MTGSHEVRGSIPLSSTKRVLEGPLPGRSFSVWGAFFEVGEGKEVRRDGCEKKEK